jgi:beta-lactam-binding protein with PASTA domain
MIKKHGEDLERQFIFDQEIENRIKDLSGQKSDESVKQIKEIYDQLKAKK